MAIDALPSSFVAGVQTSGPNGAGEPTNLQHSARKTAEEFEHSFLTTMLGSMFEGVETSAPFGGGHAEQQFRSVLLGEYAKDMAKAGGIGIADEVYREILAIQEGKK